MHHTPSSEPKRLTGTLHELSSMEALITEMLNGFPSLKTATASLKLSLGQQMKLEGILATVRLYRKLLMPLKKKQYAKMEAEFKALTQIDIKIPDYGLQPGPENHYLSRAEVDAFEQSGLLGPFRVMSASQAADYHALAYREFEKDKAKGGGGFFGDEVREAIQKHGKWNLNYWGTYQMLNHKPLRDLLRRPPVAQRMASLLGPDVICWRSQFFEKAPGTAGTFWHQASAFQEVSKKRKLKPTEPISPAMIQLTCWIALSKVTVPNGAMRIMPGSYRDGRLERLYEYGRTNQLDLLAHFNPKTLREDLKTVLFSTGAFFRSQVVFNYAVERFPDLFGVRTIQDLTMNPGEAVIFTSANMHGSYSNVTEGDTRLAFAGRFTRNSTKVYDGIDSDVFSTPEGYKPYSTAPLACIQIHGTDKFDYNKMLNEPGAD